ncbi:MAG: CBS domain-containing protein [Candidatus Altiarchaeota archaeon]|nr:CBS domain-containing protein [Candidatus Altiarchaeota archaeon]
MAECNLPEVDKVLVRDVMTTHVIQVGPNDPVVEVGGLLAEKRISGAVVVDGGIKGVISKESFVAGVKYMGENPLSSFKVSDFMSKSYETADAGEPLGAVVDRINCATCRVDRVIVLDNGKLAGVLTKSDISRVFAEHAKGCLKVGDIMQVNPSIVYDYTPLSKILREITMSRDKRVIVMAGQSVLGVITVLDLSLAMFEKLKLHEGKNPLDFITLDDVITLNPVTTSEKTDAAEAAGIMVGKRIGGMPVVDSRLMGVLTKNDIVKGYPIFRNRIKRRH